MRFSPQWDLPHIANFTGRQHFPIATLMRHGDDPMRFAKTLATERNTRGADRTRLDCFSVGWIEYRSFQKTQRRMELGQSPAIAPLRPIRLRPCVQRLLYGSRSMSSPLTRPIRNSRTAKITRITRQHHCRPGRSRRDHSADVASKNASLLSAKKSKKVRFIAGSQRSPAALQAHDRRVGGLSR